jgi:ceramide glucosyltransferase
VLVTVILVALTLLSVGLLLWQYTAALRFPLHQQIAVRDFTPAISLLKPLKGCDEFTADCLRSWMTQRYNGEIQLLFGVADENDPACVLVREMIQAFPNLNAQLVITCEPLGPNAKVGNLVQLARHAKHDVLCVSDADVHVEEDFLANAIAPLREAGVGLVNCFYQFAGPKTFAMRWEAMAMNADFWSQVLQSNTLHRQDFALGAVMITRRETLAKIGGFEPLLEYLADDYQLGRRIAATGARIELVPVVVECRNKTMSFREVWNHQLRWARTIRVSQPLPYFFSILSNVTFWSLLLIAFGSAYTVPVLGMTDSGAFYFPLWRDAATADSAFYVETGYSAALLLGIAAILLRMIIASSLAVRFTRQKMYRELCWIVPIKDLLQFGIWFTAFLGNTVEWSGRRFRIIRGGKLDEVK